MTMTNTTDTPRSYEPLNMLTPTEISGPDATEPEMTLWIAVLNQAVKDAKALVQKVENDPDLWSNPLFRSEVIHLKRYFRSQSMEPGSFTFICDLMGMDPKQAAKQINEMYLQHLIKPITKRPTQTARLMAV
jgi:hypothetical protein